MLTNTLNTNEVMNASGTEVEFSRLSIDGRSTTFAKISESPAAPHRLTIAHQETGSGIKRRRRSVTRVDLTSISDVDSTTPATDSAYLVLDSAIGAKTTNADAKAALAELGSFVHTLGTNTHLYDGTGTGAAALLAGGL